MYTQFSRTQATSAPSESNQNKLTQRYTKEQADSFDKTLTTKPRGNRVRSFSHIVRDIYFDSSPNKKKTKTKTDRQHRKRNKQST